MLLVAAHIPWMLLLIFFLPAPGVAGVGKPYQRLCLG